MEKEQNEYEGDERCGEQGKRELEGIREKRKKFHSFIS